LTKAGFGVAKAGFEVAKASFEVAKASFGVRNLVYKSQNLIFVARTKGDIFIWKRGKCGDLRKSAIGLVTLRIFKPHIYAVKRG
jgi:hypothetical protein